MAQYQSASTALIHTFENDLESPGFTRGCPDFVFTVLTYAAVSLLRVTQPQFAYLEPDRTQVFSTARKAADMLARSAMTPDHLPASQSVFLSRLIEVKSAEPQRYLQPQQAQQGFVPEMIDFEAFGQSLEGDQTMTQWPPAPFNFDLSSFAAPVAGAGSSMEGQTNNVGLSQHSHGGGHQPQHTGAGGMTAPANGMIGSGGAAAGVGSNGPANAATTASSTMSSLPTDLDGWVAATQFPMSGLSLGMFGGGQDDLLFTQDSFWKSIFEGQPQNQGQGMGMV